MRQWFPVMCRAQREVDAAKRLKQLGLGVCLPMRHERREYTRQGRGMVVRRSWPWLTGYLFVRCAPGDLHKVKGPHVITVLYVAGEPVSIKDDQVDGLRAYFRTLNRKPGPAVVELYEPGTRLEMLHQAYIGYTGIVRIDEGAKISISCAEASAYPITVTDRSLVRPVEEARRVA